MPCWETNVLATNFSTEHKQMFWKAVSAIGLQVIETTWKDEKIWIVGENPTILNDPIVIWPDRKEAKCKSKEYEQKFAKLKRAYSLEAVKSVASKKKWFMSQKQNQITVKRY